MSKLGVLTKEAFSKVAREFELIKNGELNVAELERSIATKPFCQYLAEYVYKKQNKIKSEQEINIEEMRNSITGYVP